MKKQKVAVVMPAYNAELTLEKTIADIPLDYISELILVDDLSTDNTVELARKIGLDHERLTLSRKNEHGKIPFTIKKLPQNRGYGGNQKECYHIALEYSADIIVMIHPDYQYDPKLVREMVESINNGYGDVILGSRMRSWKEAKDGGMPLYKYCANKILSFIEGKVSGCFLSDWHTGMRAYTKNVLLSVDFERFSNDFIFDTQMLFAIIEHNFTTKEIPVSVRYFKEASSINLKRSIRYGLQTLWETYKHSFKKKKITQLKTPIV